MAVIPSLEEIITDPQTAMIPSLDEDKGFLAGKLIEETTEDNFNQLVDYFLRPEFNRGVTLMFVMAVVRKNYHLAEKEGFIKWAKTHQGLRQ